MTTLVGGGYWLHELILAKLEYVHQFYDASRPTDHKPAAWTSGGTLPSTASLARSRSGIETLRRTTVRRAEIARLAAQLWQQAACSFARHLAQLRAA